VYSGQLSGHKELPHLAIHLATSLEAGDQQLGLPRNQNGTSMEHQWNYYLYRLDLGLSSSGCGCYERVRGSVKSPGLVVGLAVSMTHAIP
jgi:hypothetical protein